MSIMEQLLNRILWWRKAPQNINNPANLEKFLHRWENYIIGLQYIIVWENPILSLLCVGAVNIIFWTVVYLEWRLYGMIFFALLLFVVADWTKHHGVWGNSSNPTDTTTFQHRVVSMEELTVLLRGVESKSRVAFFKIRNLRQQQPATFCVVACVCCLLLSLVGRALPGVLVMYLFIMSSCTAPALCVRYPQCLRFLSGLGLFIDSDSEVEGYLPEASDGTLRILSLEDETQGPSVPYRDTLFPSLTPSGDASLHPVVSLMPSLEHSLDFLGPDVELPSPRQVDADLSDESDLSESHGLEFKTRHFNGEGSSTSSGEELSHGLRFRGLIQREASSDSSGSFELVSKDDL